MQLTTMYIYPRFDYIVQICYSTIQGTKTKKVIEYLRECQKITIGFSFF